MIQIRKLSVLFINYYALIASLVVLIFYTLTLAPGLIASDSGELAAVQYTLGIAHPTGYPLFTILGFIFSHLPIPLRPITKLNLLSALWSVGTVYVLIITIKFILDNLKYFLGKLSNFDRNIYERFYLDEKYKIVSAVFGGLTFGFSKTLWFQSISVEVYSLHIFLFSLTFYFILRAFVEDSENQEIKLFKDKWIFAFIFLALGFTNHLSTVFIVPTFLLMYFYDLNFSSKNLKRFFTYSFVGFVITFLIYLYIPLRALTQPLLNWGNPVSFGDFINHITGRLYHQFLFPSFGEYISNIGHFLNTFSISFDRAEFYGSDFSILIVLAFLGMITSFFFFRKLFNLLIVIFLVTMFVSSFYDIPDIDAYYLSAHFVIGIFSSLGIFYLSSIKVKERIKQVYVAFILIIGVILQINHNYSRVDLSDATLIDDYTVNLLNSVENGAVLVSARSSFYFPTLYYQIVEGVRRDVVVAEHYLLQQKWYYTQLNKIHPGIIELKDTVATINFKHRDIYLSSEMIELHLRGAVKIFEDNDLVPVNFLFKMVPKGQYVEMKPFNYNFDFSKKHLAETEELKQLILSMFLNRSVYELAHGYIEKSKECLYTLKKIAPEYELPSNLRKILNE